MKLRKIRNVPDDTSNNAAIDVHPFSIPSSIRERRQLMKKKIPVRKSNVPNVSIASFMLFSLLGLSFRSVDLAQRFSV